MKTWHKLALAAWSAMMALGIATMTVRHMTSPPPLKYGGFGAGGGFTPGSVPTATLATSATGTNLNLAGTLTTSQFNMSPALALGKIGWQAGGCTVATCTFLNTWSPAGLGTATQVYANASDNQGTMITGICSRTACGASRNFAKGDHLDVCNSKGPLDDGVIMLSNEDTRTPNVLDQILLPNSGIPGQGVSLAYAIPPGAGCAHLVYDEYDHVNNPGDMRWHVDTSSSRQPNITVQYFGLFPDAIANGMHGTYNDFRPGNAATALSGPQGYSTTVAVASNNQVLAGGANTYTINVASTTGFTGPSGSTTIIPIAITHGGTIYSFTCTGIGSSTMFTGCLGAAVTLSTNDAVAGGLCDAGTTCLWDDYTAWTIQGTDTSTVILTGLFYGGNARPSGEGPTKVLCNAGPGLLQLNHADAGSTAADRMQFPDSLPRTVKIKECVTMFHSTLYNGVWLPVGYSPSGTLLNRQVLTAASGTYTPTLGTKQVVLEEVAGGGGGGGCTGTGGQTSASAGGASGSYLKVFVNCAGFCTGGAFTNGTLGAAGTAGNNAGTAGGDATIVINGTTWTARGGGGGAGMASVTTFTTAQGGRFLSASSTADVNVESVPGENGVAYSATVAMSGNGGSSPMGQGGAGESSTQGGAFLAHGAGAGGAGVVCVASSLAGGSGTAGQMIVWEYN